MTELLKKLCALDGVSGDEDNVRAFIREHAEKYADNVQEDTLGNLVVYKKGAVSEKTVMLSAYMDEAGVMVTHITEEGYVGFSCVGDIDRRVLLGKEIYIGKNRVYGVIGNKAIHLVKSDERGKIPKTDDMYIDIGAQSKKAAEKLISIGDTGSFESAVYEYGSNMLKGKGIGGRAGCAVLMKLMERKLPQNCYFVFTVQRLIGVRGAGAAAYRIKPDAALVLDAAVSADIPSVPGSRRITSSGGGAVIPFMDKGTIYDRGLYALLKLAAEENEIKWQTKSAVEGVNETSVIQRALGGVRAAAAAVPVRNLNTPASTVCLEDVRALYSLTGAFLQRIGEEI